MSLQVAINAIKGKLHIHHPFDSPLTNINSMMNRALISNNYILKSMYKAAQAQHYTCM